MNDPVRLGELPPEALLHSYREAGAFVDCYICELEGEVALPAFVEAFYTTRLFKLERFILRWLAGRPSTDAAATQLAEGSADSFAAWRVESRKANQLLLADFMGRTKSWLMVAPVTGSHADPMTRLHFGSAVVPLTKPGTGARRSMGIAFHALSGFHRLYSRLLLGAARARLRRHMRADYN